VLCGFFGTVQRFVDSFSRILLTHEVDQRVHLVWNCSVHVAGLITRGTALALDRDGDGQENQTG